MATRVVFLVVRAAIVVAVVAAVIGQLNVSLAFWRAGGVTHPGVYVVNFFSFFTIESNLIAAAAALIGFVALLAGSRRDPVWFLVLRLCAATYMATTGIVYNTLLRGIDLPQGSTSPWSNELLHVVAPALMVVDWLFAPGRRPLSFRSIGVVVAFPIVWAAYTLIRGPLTADPLRGASTWYPYPFLDPALSPLGYGAVAMYVVLIAAIISALGVLFVWIARRVAQPTSRSDARVGRPA